MPKSDRNLRVALSKCKHIEKREWYAYATPSEALELVKAGAMPRHQSDVVRFTEMQRVGNCRSWWFYFTPNANLTELLHERFR